MKFFIDNLPVSHAELRFTSSYIFQIVFPYDRIYPGKVKVASCFERPKFVTEQYAYMCDLKRTLDATVHSFTAFASMLANDHARVIVS